MSQNIENTTLAEVKKRLHNTSIQPPADMICLDEEDLLCGEGTGRSARSIVIRPGTRFIPEYALKDTNVDTVYIPNDIEWIGHQAFRDSTIRKLYMRETKNNKLSGVYKPQKSNQVVVCQAAFKGCESLKEFEPEIKEIKKFAFDGCSITLEQLVKTGKIADGAVIDQYAFGL